MSRFQCKIIIFLYVFLLCFCNSSIIIKGYYISKQFNSGVDIGKIRLVEVINSIKSTSTKSIYSSSSSSILPTLLINVIMKDSEFIFEAINESKKVIGSLINLYESASLLDQDDGPIKAFVQKEGNYFIANLAKTPINLIKITGIHLSKNQLSIFEGESFQLIREILPENHTENKNISWNSSDVNIAIEGSSGLINAVKDGTATLTYKINNFQLSTDVTVRKSATSDVVSPNEEIKELKNNFVNIINNEHSEISEFIDYYNSLKIKDKDFIKYLNREERYNFESKVLKYFGDNIHIEYLGDINPQSIKGLILNLDLDKIFKNDLIKLTVEINNLSDDTIFNNYLEMNKYDSVYTYMFDISILDENGYELTTFITPIEFTLSLPKYMWGLGELIIL